MPCFFFFFWFLKAIEEYELEKMSLKEKTHGSLGDRGKKSFLSLKSVFVGFDFFFFFFKFRFFLVFLFGGSRHGSQSLAYAKHMVCH